MISLRAALIVSGRRDDDGADEQSIGAHESGISHVVAASSKRLTLLCAPHARRYAQNTLGYCTLSHGPAARSAYPTRTSPSCHKSTVLRDALVGCPSAREASWITAQPPISSVRKLQRVEECIEQNYRTPADCSRRRVDCPLMLGPRASQVCRRCAILRGSGQHQVRTRVDAPRTRP
jgi:hypothetical protein